MGPSLVLPLFPVGWGFFLLGFDFGVGVLSFGVGWFGAQMGTSHPLPPTNVFLVLWGFFCCGLVWGRRFYVVKLLRGGGVRFGLRPSHREGPFCCINLSLVHSFGASLVSWGGRGSIFLVRGGYEGGQLFPCVGEIFFFFLLGWGQGQVIPVSIIQH